MMIRYTKNKRSRISPDLLSPRGVCTLNHPQKELIQVVGFYTHFIHKLLDVIDLAVPVIYQLLPDAGLLVDNHVCFALANLE